MKSIFPVCLFLILLVISCSKNYHAPDSKVLLDADLAFSDYSAKHGIQKAFIEFAHDSVVVLKPGRMPIEGLQSLVDSYKGRSDSNRMLTWKPTKALIAQSGELGYTYGIWTFVAANDTSKGTYLTIWKKNNKGEWKYIADTGNEGIGK
ncbi:MAG: YybH family protein [Candidatus Saccharibacteria bacterium]